MNNIKYVNKKGDHKVIRVGQGGMDYAEQNGQRKRSGALPSNHSKRRLLMIEADRKMYRAGYRRARE